MLEVVTMVGMVVEVVCLQDLTLKVSGQYLNFWLSYGDSLIKLLTCQGDEREMREVNLVIALPLLQLGKGCPI